MYPDLLNTSSLNQAFAGGTDGTLTISDPSDTGLNPESTNPGPQGDSGDEDDPTLIPGLSIVKNHGDPVRSATDSSQWVVPMTILVENTGSLELSSLILLEDIEAHFGFGVYLCQ